jgi:hypothetical protein
VTGFHMVGSEPLGGWFQTIKDASAIPGISGNSIRMQLRVAAADG